MNTSPWSDLGSIPPRDLTPARLVAHYAAQPMAAAAYALLPMQEDHSHTNLLWSADRRLLVGRPLPRGGRCFLDIPRLRTGLVSETGATVALELVGQTLAEAFEGMTGLLREVGEEVSAGGLELPSYDLPDAPLSSGAIFEAAPASLAELGRWFAIGAEVLTEIARSQLDGAELRGWPHHFDLAALLTLDPDRDPERARSLNVGLSPGDGSYDEPYFYASPWPYPDPGALHELPDGARWHTEGYTAAVLTGSRVLEAGDASGLAGVLRSMVARSLELIGS